MTTQTAETASVGPLGGDDSNAVVEDSGVALVGFYTGWCGTCKRMKPVLDEPVQNTDATILAIDTESALGAPIEFGARSTPTFVPFVDGHPVERRRGGQDEPTLRTRWPGVATSSPRRT